ncbi:MAG: hypothetical protein E2577_16495, partial [Starkeya sp.]|nr:hypothetical protein [Starkeya sp.]
QIEGLRPASGLRIEVGAIEGRLFGAMVLRDVRFHDPQGRFARVARADLDASAPARLEDMPAGAYAVVTVEDEGCGMTPEVLEKALNPFFSTKPAESGSGLGLATVYGFARQSGGNLLIESAAGCGTRVTLVLPAA